MNRSSVCLAVALTLALFAGCQTSTAPAVSTAAPQWIKSEVYFGRDLPGGGQVSRAEWADFLDKVVTPRFPKGLTIYDAYGQMQHADGWIEKQSTWVIILLHPQDPAVDRSVREIIDAYRKQFNKAQIATVSHPLAAAGFYAD